MKIVDPLNLRLMNVNDAVTRNNLQRVTSHATFEATSTRFHPDGLFSEEIFGRVGSQERMETFGYIDLKTKILSPHVFKMIMTLKSYYEPICASKKYAIFDKTLKDFILVDKTHPQADTGYNFFMSHLKDIKFQQTGSIKREKKIKLVTDYAPDRLFIDKFLVSPAGTRDIIYEQDGSVSSDEVNKFYRGVLGISQSIPDTVDGDLVKLYDTIKYLLQKKVNIVYDYYYAFTLGNGKRSFSQSRYVSRATTIATRNVISCIKLEADTPDDPSVLKHDEFLLPTYHAVKSFQPSVTKAIRSVFIDPWFNLGTTSVLLIDPKSYDSKYTEITEKELTKWLTSDGINQIFNSFADNEFRAEPVTILGKDGNKYNLLSVYDEGDVIYYFKNKDEFKEQYEALDMNQAEGKKFDKSKVRALTYIEMLYVACLIATKDACLCATRDPVIELGSIQPAKVQVATTTKYRTVKLISQHVNSEHAPILPRYPILGSSYHESDTVHSSRLQGYGGDFDGDTMSVKGVMSKEAKEEQRKFLRSPFSIVDLNRKFISTINDNYSEVVIYNLTRFSPQSPKKTA